MSGLRLGDIILDPRSFVCLPSIRVLACSGLRSALASKNVKIINEVIEKTNYSLNKYNPETLIIFCSLNSPDGLQSISKKWGGKYRIIFISKNPSPEAAATCEKLKFEIHQELVWNKFRFIELFETPPFMDPSEMQALDFQFLTLAGGVNHYVKIGKVPFDPLGLFYGKKLEVFLKGLGRLEIPSMDPNIASTFLLSSAENLFYNRYDVFAMGHSRILPLGKLSEINQFVSHSILPVSRKALGGKRKKTASKDMNSQLPN